MVYDKSFGADVVYVLPKAPTGSDGKPLYEVILTSSSKPVDNCNALEHFIRKSNFAGWFKNARIVRRQGGPFYLYTSILEPHFKNVLLIGDVCARQEVDNQGQ